MYLFPATYSHKDYSPEEKLAKEKPNHKGKKGSAEAQWTLDRKALDLAWRKTQTDQAHSRHSEPGFDIVIGNAGENKRNVLIVDDDEDSLLVAQYIVEALGYTVYPVHSGHSVVSVALECCPDIILLDIRLDGINGLDVYRQLRQHEQLTNVPVVAVTALARPSERSTVLAAGFSDFLLKPYLANDLCNLINEYLPAR